MTEGRYTLTEIDAMRSALQEWRQWDGSRSEPYVEGSFPAGSVEEVLRTYMLAGASVEEVCAHALVKRDAGLQGWALERAECAVRWAKRCARP